MACFLQSLCVQLGVMTGKDLSQACRAYLHPYLNFFLFLLAEIAMIATDLAEVIGAAIALKLLFDIPFKIGIAVTCLDVLFILMFWNDKYQKTFEFVIFVLVLVVGGCFVALVTKTDPVWSQVAQGFVPSADIFKDQNILFIALGIMGATIMPHNCMLLFCCCASHNGDEETHA